MRWAAWKTLNPISHKPHCCWCLIPFENGTFFAQTQTFAENLKALENHYFVWHTQNRNTKKDMCMPSLLICRDGVVCALTSMRFNKTAPFLFRWCFTILPKITQMNICVYCSQLSSRACGVYIAVCSDGYNIKYTAKPCNAYTTKSFYMAADRFLSPHKILINKQTNCSWRTLSHSKCAHIS